MKSFHILIIGLICVVMAGLISPVAALDAALEPLPVDLKAPVEGATYEDDAFFEEAGAIISTLSNRTIPTGSQRMKIYSAYISLRDMDISPENYEDARAALAFLYYTSKASEAYENFFDVQKNVASLTDGSEFYDLADIYYTTASNWWDLIADRYPKVTLYSLPGRDDPLPEAGSQTGTVLEGLKYPITMAQVAPDTSRAFEDSEVKKTIQRWVEDNIEGLPNASDLKGQSLGNYFLTSDGPKWAKSTYTTISRKNVNPDFYDTANYIDAFLFFISQSHDYYQQYLDERQSFLLISEGQEPYDMSKSYYDQAGIALSRFIKQVPEVNQSAYLPDFPRFDEVSRGRMTLQQEDNQYPGQFWGSAYS